MGTVGRPAHVRRVRAAIATVSCAALTFLLSSTSYSSAATSSPGLNPPPPGSGCTPVPVASITYETIDGAPASGPGDTVATIYHYALAPGDDIEQIAPPKTFSPLSATDAQLAAMGFEPRPTDPVQLAAWNARYASFKGFVGQQLCVQHDSAN